MSDAWEEIQAVKTKRNSLREKLNKRRREREDLLGGGSDTNSTNALPATNTEPEETKHEPSVVGKADKEVEDHILCTLTELALNLPTDSGQICSLVSKQLEREISHLVVRNLLQKFAAQDLIRVNEDSRGNKAVLTVTWAEHARLVAMVTELESSKSTLNHPLEEPMSSSAASRSRDDMIARPSKKERKDSRNDDVMNLLSLASTREKENKRMGEEILDLLSKPTAKERSLVERFRSQGGAQVQEFCSYGTREECRKGRVQSGSEGQGDCHRLHFRKIIQPHTDESLGDCSFLNTCFHMETCKYVHYQVDYQASKSKNSESESGQQLSLALEKAVRPSQELGTVLYPPQWIQCDLRTLDMNILGKCSVIMADPPWDIHMELPYGTLSDDEMRQLNIPVLQDDGLIFLWVTGRAMELGRECLELWGYERVDEIIWVKTNQLQRIIRTGRTGHWLNHGKEHCLVGMKGNPRNLNKGLDCDVIVAEVRATSHKPDEMYGIIERLSPGTRKVELFGRPHNVQPNWITLGNQLDGVHLLDPDIAKAFQKRYPDGNCL